MRIYICIAFAIGAFLSSLAAHATRPFTLADDIRYQYVGDPFQNQLQPVTFSPDNRYFVVVTEHGLLERNRAESILYVFRTHDILQFLRSASTAQLPSPIWTVHESPYKDGPAVSSIRWLADSSGIALLAKSAIGTNQLVLADLRSKTVRTLTPADQHVTGFDIRSANDFVYAAFSPLIKEKSLVESHAISINGTGEDLRSLTDPYYLDPELGRSFYSLSDLWVCVHGKRFRLENGATRRPIHVYYKGQQALAISPDGRSVVTALPLPNIPVQWEKLYLPQQPGGLANGENKLRAGHQDTNAFEEPLNCCYVSIFAVIDVINGTITPLTGAPVGDVSAGWAERLSADWSANGRLVLLSSTFFPPQTVHSKNEPNRPCVAIIDVASKQMICLKKLTPTDDRVIMDAHFSESESQRVIIDYNDNRRTTYVRSGESWSSTSTIDTSAVSGGGLNLTVKQGVNQPAVLVATNRTTNTSRVIFNPNPWLKSVQLANVSILEYTDANSFHQRSGLYMPPNHAAGRRYPLIIQTHGFLEDVFAPAGIYTTAFAAQELAAVGFIVLQTSDSCLESTPAEGPCAVANYEAAVQTLVSRGFVDPNRIGIIGFSRTVYHVLEALTTSKVHFAAASITDGVNVGYLQYMQCADLFASGCASFYNALIGAPPFGAGLQKWLKLSPEFNMDKVTTPLEVVALGRGDILFMWEPYAELRYLRKPVDLTVINDNEHVLRNPDARIASQGGTIDWFRFWLQGYEDPAPAKREQYARWHVLRKLQQAGNVTPVH